MLPSRRRVVAGVVALGVLTGWLLLSPSAAVSRLRGVVLGPWFPLVLIGLYAVRPLLAWPITLLSALVGFRYGVVIGLPVALVGAVLTSLPPFLAGRRVADDGGLWGRLADGSRRYFDSTGGLRGVVAARLAPTPAEPVSAAAGTAGVSTLSFVVGTVLGELPWTVAGVAAGASMNDLALAGAAPGPWLLVVCALAAAALLAGPAYRYLTAS